jgi:hypothetical protein
MTYATGLLPLDLSSKFARFAENFEALFHDGLSIAVAHDLLNRTMLSKLDSTGTMHQARVVQTASFQPHQRGWSDHRHRPYISISVAAMRQVDIGVQW